MSSDYEQQRAANIVRNEGVLESLGLGSPSTEKEVAQKKKVKQPAKPAAAPTRRSSRQEKLPAPDYASERVIDDGPEDDDNGNKSSRGVKRHRAGAADEEEEDEGPPRKKVELPPTIIVPLPSGAKYDPAAVQAHFPDFDVAVSAPTRTGPGGGFRFSAAPGAGSEEKARAASFQPNRSPEEVLRAGAFGGTYFRTITSGVTKQTHKDAWKELPVSWTKGLAPAQALARPWAKYNLAANKYNAKCGQTLEEWEASGWMSMHDPFGWFQWYCRFFMGRRCDDDDRQISRWLKCCGPTGRWKGNLCGKVLIARAEYDDASVSPVVRQTLLHWGYELTEADFQKAEKKIRGGKGAYNVNRGQLQAAAAKKKDKK